MRAERLACDGDDFSSFTHSQLLICPLRRLLQIYTAAKKSQMFICAKRELKRVNVAVLASWTQKTVHLQHYRNTRRLITSSILA